MQPLLSVLHTYSVSCMSSASHTMPFIVAFQLPKFLTFLHYNLSISIMSSFHPVIKPFLCLLLSPFKVNSFPLTFMTSQQTTKVPNFTQHIKTIKVPSIAFSVVNQYFLAKWSCLCATLLETNYV